MEIEHRGNRMISLRSHIDEHQNYFRNKFYRTQEEAAESSSSLAQVLVWRDHQPAIWASYFLRYSLLNVCERAVAEQSKERTSLHLSNWSLPFLPTALLSENGVTLKTMELSRNHFVVVPSALLICTSLRKLSLANNHLRAIPSLLFKYVSLLEELNVKGNLLSELPSLKDLPKLVRLFVSDNRLTELKDVPVTIKSLDIGNNPLVVSSILKEEFTSLGLLELASLSLQTLPKQLFSYASMKILNISNNDLSTLPSDITKLAQLQELTIGGNPFGTIPDVLLSITTLRKLYIDKCNLFSVPPAIKQLSMLRRLNLDENNLDSLPAEFENLTDLQELCLAKNRFTAVPTVLSKLSKLEFLSLAHNLISVIPSDISDLSHLQSLDVSYNSISFLPVNLSKLPLKTLKLAGNPWRSPPPEVIALGVNSLMEHLRSLAGQQMIPNNQLSLMVVGHEKSGKSSLVKGLIERREGNFECTTPTTDTSINITRIREPIKLMRDHQDEKRTLVFDTWDFTGSDLLLIAHLFFRSDTTLYLLCWNMELSLEDARLEYWLQMISRRAPQAPVILIGTHADTVGKGQALSTTNAVYEKFYGRFPGNVRSVVSVSWSKGHGFDRVWRAIESALQNEPWMAECFPARFGQLKESLLGEAGKRATPIISTKEIHDLSVAAAIPTSQLDAAMSTMLRFGYIHALPGDNSVFVLDVEWLIGFISSLFKASKTVWTNGILKHDLLEKIWNPLVYEPKYHPVIIELLEVFSGLISVFSLSNLPPFYNSKAFH